MKEILKKYIGEVLLLLGAFLAIYNVMGFDSKRECGLVLAIGGGECGNPVAYFYSDEVRLMAALGLLLFVTGLLVVKQRGRGKIGDSEASKQ